MKMFTILSTAPPKPFLKLNMYSTKSKVTTMQIYPRAEYIFSKYVGAGQDV